MAVPAPHARPRGRHFLRSRALADRLVADAGVAPGDLALDLGAGHGILTGALRAARARVVAVELDAAACDELRRRFAKDTAVDVVAGDVLDVPLPAEPFRVVANIPFAFTTAVFRRLLGDPRIPLTQLDAVVEWGFAARKCAVWPSTSTAAHWGAWYELRVVRRIPRSCFAPPPSVDAALVRATRRESPLVALADAAAYAAFLRRAFGDFPVERAVGRGIVRRLAHELGFDARARGRDLDAVQWAALFSASRSSRRPRSRAR